MRISPIPALTAEAKLLRTAVELAALFHDVGKASRWFQEKLARETDQADWLRHEVLSAWFFEALVVPAADDRAWLAGLASTDCSRLIGASDYPYFGCVRSLDGVVLG